MQKHRLWKRPELGPAFSLKDGKAGQVLPPKLCHGGAQAGAQCGRMVERTGSDFG